jgi:hypothetical protein
MSLGNFLKTVNLSLHEQYIFERYSKGETGHSNYKKPEFNFKWKLPPGVSKTAEKTYSCFLDGKYSSITELHEDSEVRKYVLKRQIPDRFLKQIYFVPDFKELIDSVEPENEYGLRRNDQRIVIPFFDVEGKVIALQGRSLGDSTLRYITIKVDKDAPKIFGLDRVDPNQRILVVEAPIDSMFLDNAIATAGASINTKDLHNIGDNLVFVFDNECRKKAIVEDMLKVVEAGEKVCVWPETLKEKDINDMVLSGKTPTQIMDIIKENTFEGLKAQIAIGQWRRC